MIVSNLELYRTQVIEGRMEALPVEPTHPGHRGRLHLLPSRPRLPVGVNQLRLVQADGALHQGVVVRGADAADAATDAVLKELVG